MIFPDEYYLKIILFCQQLSIIIHKKLNKG